MSDSWTLDISVKMVVDGMSMDERRAVARDRVPDSHQRMLPWDLKTGREEAQENKTDTKRGSTSEGGVDSVLPVWRHLAKPE